MAADTFELNARLVENHKEALQLMEVVGKHYGIEQTSSVPVCEGIVRSNLRTMRYQLLGNKRKLDSIHLKIRDAGAMSLVSTVNNILQECQKRVSDFRTFLNETVVPLLREGELTDQKVSETYATRSNVPPNPPRMTLDYTTEETCEGRLKAAILEGTSSGVVGIVASGPGGVGKTCALRGLANDSEIRKRFKNGILYMSLGNDSRLSGIVSELACAVDVTGEQN